MGIQNSQNLRNLPIILEKGIQNLISVIIPFRVQNKIINDCVGDFEWLIEGKGGYYDKDPQKFRINDYFGI